MSLFDQTTPKNAFHIYRSQCEKTNKEYIFPPAFKTKPGGPKRCRKKGNDEIKKTDRLSRNGRKIKCSNCKQYGHNKKGYKKYNQSSTSISVSRKNISNTGINQL